MEKPSVNSEILSEEEKARRRRALFQESLTGDASSESLPSESVIGDEEVEIRPNQDDAGAAERREEMRKWLLQGEGAGVNEITKPDSAALPSSGIIHPDGRISRG